MTLTGGKRKANKSLKAWVTFVKKVQKEEKLSYKDAIHRAKQRKDKGEKWMKGGNDGDTVSDEDDFKYSEPDSFEEGAMMDNNEMGNNEMGNNEIEMDEDNEMMGGKRRRRTMRRRRSSRRRGGSHGGSRRRRCSRRRRH